MLANIDMISFILIGLVFRPLDLSVFTHISKEASLLLIVAPMAYFAHRKVEVKDHRIKISVIFYMACSLRLTSAGGQRGRPGIWTNPTYYHSDLSSRTISDNIRQL